MTPRSLAALPALFAAFVMTGCGGKATRAECDAMLERYLDLTINQDPQLARYAAKEKAAVREVKRELKSGEKAFRTVKTQCEAKVTRSVRDCAMEATSPGAWEACIP